MERERQAKVLCLSIKVPKAHYWDLWIKASKETSEGIRAYVTNKDFPAQIKVKERNCSSILTFAIELPRDRSAW